MGGFQAKYLPIILALRNDPEASIKDVANKINISWPTAKKRYEEAKDQEIIKRIVANYDYRKLGYRRYFIVADLSNYYNLKTLEELCNRHPYTTYRSRIIGGGSMSLFMIFQVPDTNSGDNNIKDIFQILYREKIIESYNLYMGNSKRIFTKYDLDRFNFDREEWDFSPEKWIVKLPHYRGRRTPEKVDFDLSTLDEKQLFILRLMSDNLMPTQKMMQEIFERHYEKISKSEFHRQYSYLKENLIYDIELVYNYELFGISTIYLYILSDLTTTEIEQFIGLVENDPPPFKFNLEVVGQSQLIMWGNMPVHLAKEFSYHLWKRFSKTKTYALSNKSGWGARYLFYHKNFDDEKKCWKDSYSYMVEEPLKNIIVPHSRNEL